MRANRHNLALKALFISLQICDAICYKCANYSSTHHSTMKHCICYRSIKFSDCRAYNLCASQGVPHRRPPTLLSEKRCQHAANCDTDVCPVDTLFLLDLTTIQTDAICKEESHFHSWSRIHCCHCHGRRVRPRPANLQ